MATTVDELITIYKAVDQHTPVAKGIAQTQAQMGKGMVDTTRIRQQGQKVLQGEIKTLEQSLKLQMQATRLSKEEANERAAVARAISAETRVREAETRALEKQERATRQLNAARKFAQGFGSTRLNFGAASPLISSFTRGGLAGGLGALTATGLGAGMAGIGALGNAAMSGAQNLLSGAGQGLLSIGQMAEEASMAASSRQARLTAILRNAQTAAQVLKQAEAVAAPSTATTKQMADAATTLEAFGVNAMRTLPIIGKLATAMGAGEEQMQMYSRAVGQLGTGNMIDADVMAAMGLQRRDFAQQGIRFDGNGKLLSTAEESLKALERIVNDRFGNIFEQMANTPEAKRASLEDAGQRALRIIGDGMLKTQGPIVDAITKSLNAAVDSGVLAEVVGKITKSLGGVFGGDASNPMMRLMASAMSVIGNIPSVAGKALRFVGDTFSVIFENIATAGKFAYDTLSAIWRLIGGPSAVQDLLGTSPGQGDVRAYDRDNKASGGSPFAPKWSKGVMQSGMFGSGSLQGLADLVVKMVGYTPGGALMNFASPYLKEFALGQFGMGDKGLIPGLPALPKFKSLPQFKDYGGDVDLMKDAERYYKMLMGVGGKQGGITDASGQSFLRRAIDPDNELAKIAENTEKTAKNTDPDLREAIFGGGSRARRGISFADVMGGAAGRSGGYTIRTDKAATTLQMALLEVLQENLPDIFADYQRRAGVLS